MTYQIEPMRIEENTTEARALEAIISRERVSPEEAVRSALRRAFPRTPAERMIGAFSSDEDAALMDEVTALIKESRRTSLAPSVG